MTKSDRYDSSALAEAQFEPGSRGRVLKNLLHITRKREMDVVEAEQYALAIPLLVERFEREHRFTATDVCDIHRIWLGNVYSWAGRYRQVNLSKGDFSFAMARHIPALMEEFEAAILGRYTPCIFSSDEEIITALAAVHSELMLIHPFREGNGRAGRLLSVLMAFQAGLPGLDFSGVTGQKRKEYFAAVRAGMDRNYEPMKRVFSAVLSRTKRRLGG